MKIVVDFDKCKSHGKCMKAAPELFEVRADGFLYVLDETPPEALRKKAETAAKVCPEQAIKIDD